MTRRFALALVVAAACWAGASPVSARLAQGRGAAPVPPSGGPQTPPPQPRGTGLILGQVVDGDSGKPVGGVQVSLNGSVAITISSASGPAGRGSGAVTLQGPALINGMPANAVNQRVLTDGNGWFVFHDLPKAAYSLGASTPGYMGGGYGQRIPTGPSRPLELAEGERLGNVRLSIWKYSTLSGTVFDESGEPVVGMSVTAFRRSIVGGRPRLSRSSVAPTDDRGVFRLSSLSPGEYTVGVLASRNTVPLTVAEDYMKAMEAPRGPGGAEPPIARSLNTSGAPSVGNNSGLRVGDFLIQQSNMFGAAGLTGPAPTEDGRLVVYQSTFFPAASSLAQASLVRVASGEDKSGLDLQVRLVPAVRISGMLTGPDGPVPHVGVHLLPNEDSGPDSITDAATTVTDANGAFTFLGVTSGAYTIRVTKIPRPPQATPSVQVFQTSQGTYTTSSAMSTQAPTVPTEPTLWAELPVSVGEADLSGLVLTARPGLRISGFVQFDGAAARPTPEQLQRISVNVNPTAGTPGGGYSPGRVNAQGQFTTMGYTPGKYVINAGSPGQGWTLKGVMVGGRDVSDTPLELDSSDVGSVMIVFTDRTTKLSGNVRDPKDPQNVDATVVIFPADYRPWIDNGMGGRRWRTNRTPKSGAYAFSTMPAGDYLIVAITDDPGRDAYDARYFATLAGLATRVSLGDGDQKTLDLTAVKAPNPGGEPAPNLSERVHGPFIPEVEPAQVPPPPVPVPPPPPPPPPMPQGVPGPPRDVNYRPLVGTGVLTGTVVSDDAAARPIRRAMVSLNGGDARMGRMTVTDDSGHFVFTGLPASRFTLSASKAAYVSSTWGQKKGAPATPLILAAGQHLDVSMRMPRGAVLTGTVYASNGQPASNVQMQIMQVRMVNGERTLTQMGFNGPNSTDDRGAYRIYGLAAGEYLVMATSRQYNFGQADVRATTAADVRWAQQAVRQGEAASTGASSTLAPAPGPGPAVGYAPVFYPSSMDPAGATALTLGVGEERPGVDVILQLVPTAKIEGTLVGPDNQSLESVSIVLTPRYLLSSGLRGIPTGFGVNRGQNGQFSITNVPPGEYALTARALVRTGSPGTGTPPVQAPSGNVIQFIQAPGMPMPPAGGRAGGPPPIPAVAHWAMADVNVSGRDVTGVVLSLQPGMTVSGKVAFEASTLTPPQDLSRIRVSVNAMTGQPGAFNSGTASATVDATGAFTVEGVMPGRYRLTANAPPVPGQGQPGPVPLPSGLTSLPPGSAASLGWTLKSATVNATDLLDTPLDIQPSQSVSGVTLTFSDKVTEITGLLLDRAGQPALDYSVVVFSADRTFWTPQSRRVRQTRPTSGGPQSGRFRFTGLPPGEYYVSAVTDLDPGELTNPAFLDQIVSASFKITLGEGERKTQDLKIAGGQ